MSDGGKIINLKNEITKRPLILKYERLIKPNVYAVLFVIRLPDFLARY